MRTAIVLTIWVAAAVAQTAGPKFEVASVKPSAHTVGKDYRPVVEVSAGRFTAHNASLKDLILAAYHADRYQVSGGPRWLDEDEFDVDAKSEGHPSPDELRIMLRALLADRFALAVHAEQKEMRRYALVVDRGGPKIQPENPGDPRGHFHGDLRQFANLLSVQLSIPVVDDPTRPAMATGPPVPVIDETGLTGVYNISEWPGPELGADPFVRWQRVLQDKLGLKLEAKRGLTELWVVDRAEKPRANQ